MSSPSLRMSPLSGGGSHGGSFSSTRWRKTSSGWQLVTVPLDEEPASPSPKGRGSPPDLRLELQGMPI